MVHELVSGEYAAVAISALSRSDVQDRWRRAPDRTESSGKDLLFRPVESPAQRRRLLHEIRDNSTDWAPEAVFCTLRTLINLGRVVPQDLIEILGSRRPVDS